jgi:hypothetical protein
MFYNVTDIEKYLVVSAYAFISYYRDYLLHSVAIDSSH